jgi:alpha-tubulin suppressor-like RCC1 family protein
MTATPRLINGNDWVDAFFFRSHLVALRSNRTLWLSEADDTKQEDAGNNAYARNPYASMRQFGAESNWSKIVGSLESSLLVLLKTDGTLWCWGRTGHAANNSAALQAMPPVQLGKDSDWAITMASGAMLYAWKTNGEAWLLQSKRRSQGAGQLELETNLFLERFSSLDHTQWRSIAKVGNFEVGVRADGSLWSWHYWPRQDEAPTPPTQLLAGSDWTQVPDSSGCLAGLKTDGSIWHWRPERLGLKFPDSVLQGKAAHPTRLGQRDDWLALTSAAYGVVSLAADGNLWFWESGEMYPPSLRPPSRSPTLLGNLLDLDDSASRR